MVPGICLAPGKRTTWRRAIWTDSHGRGKVAEMEGQQGQQGQQNKGNQGNQGKKGMPCFPPLQVLASQFRYMFIYTECSVGRSQIHPLLTLNWLVRRDKIAENEKGFSFRRPQIPCLVGISEG